MSADTDPEALAQHLIALDPGRRVLCAIAGAPGSGKSTVAEALVARLNDLEPGAAALLPMDGFHYDDLHLVPAGLRQRKGAPETFDVGGLRHALQRLRANDEPAVAVPVFDRDIEIARAGARLIPQSVRVIVVEGNYLLLTHPPWDTLVPFFDVTVMLDVPEDELRARLTARWTHHDLSEHQIAWKLDGNDLPNGRVVRTESAEADFRIGPAPFR